MSGTLLDHVESYFVRRFTPPRSPAALADEAVWRNGVRHHHDPERDVFVLNTTTNGVAARFETRDRGWMRAPHVEAVDRDGWRLQARAERHGLRHVLVASDAATGIETRLDPRGHDVDVRAPGAVGQRDSRGLAPRKMCAQTAEPATHQHIDADGNVFYFAHEETCTEVSSQGTRRTTAEIEATVRPADKKMLTVARLLTGYRQGDVSELPMTVMRDLDAEGRFTLATDFGDGDVAGNHAHQLFVLPTPPPQATLR